MSPSNGSNFPSGSGGNRNYIEHQVSKMDTLAGVAIKYGVEVADIKRLNGLATDLQMFALKTLQIPLPGRHPPSPVLSNGSSSPGENSVDKMPQRLGYSNMLESLESLGMKSPLEKVFSASTSLKKVSPAMSTLQKFYGLRSADRNSAAEGMEMAVYRSRSSDCFDDGLFAKASSISDAFANQQKFGNISNDLLLENGANGDFVPISEAGDGDSEKSSEKSVRRRQKPEAEYKVITPERLFKEENSCGSGGFSPYTGKGLAMRGKSASRSALTSDLETVWTNSIAVGLGDSIITDGLAGVRKSSSTPSFQEQDSSSSAGWPTSKWSLKPDLQALSTAAITRPMFDGLPKPISGRKSKAALD